MANLLLEYPKCSTCKNAKNFLDNKGISYTDRDIKLEKPNAQELKLWHEKSGMDIKKFFNTSGLVYKEKKLKDKLPDMTIEEKYQILASDGMLVKRPILVTEKGIVTGFKEAEWEKIL